MRQLYFLCWAFLLVGVGWSGGREDAYGLIIAGLSPVEAEVKENSLAIAYDSVAINTKHLAPPPFRFKKRYFTYKGNTYVWINDIVDGKYVMDIKSVSRLRKILILDDIMNIEVHQKPPKVPNRVQRWIQDEFDHMGGWPFVFILVVVAYAVWRWWVGDWRGVCYAIGIIVALIGVMVYGFKE